MRTSSHDSGCGSLPLAVDGFGGVEIDWESGDKSSVVNVGMGGRLIGSW